MDESEVEDVKKYVPGGYHPVDIGDEIDEFIVVHKLGFGGFATVWLVQSNTDNRYYALKILCAEVPSTRVVEKQVFEHLGVHNQSSIIQLLRSFEITGQMVFTLACPPSLCSKLVQVAIRKVRLITDRVTITAHLADTNLRTFTPGAKFRIAQQVCEDVAFLHQRSVAHTGQASLNRDVTSAHSNTRANGT